MEHEEIMFYFGHKKERRQAFADWLYETGKEVCDDIVLKMAMEQINWAC